MPTPTPAKKGRAKSKGKSDAPPQAAQAPIGEVDSDLWELIVDLIRPGDAVLAGILDHARVAGFSDGTLTLEVSGDITERRLVAKLDVIESLVTAQRPDIRRIRVGKVEAIANTPHLRKSERQFQAQEQRRRDVERHPLVVELLERFGATLGPIELYEPTNDS